MCCVYWAPQHLPILADHVLPFITLSRLMQSNILLLLVQFTHHEADGTLRMWSLYQCYCDTGGGESVICIYPLCRRDTSAVHRLLMTNIAEDHYWRYRFYGFYCISCLFISFGSIIYLLAFCLSLAPADRCYLITERLCWVAECAHVGNGTIRQNISFSFSGALGFVDIIPFLIAVFLT